MSISKDQNYFSILKKYFPIVTYQNEEIVTHRSHIPRVGLVLLEGEIEIIKTKSSQALAINDCVGLKELWSKTPIKYKIKVFPGTKVLSIDLSTLRELVNQNILDSGLLI